ncbi:uncharacterized protein LOC116342122 [Contarinia nasturtii]|uniref:uncharacterized protein LOC116342122 n=1 Tax=Contarinia nasturtii TaxID=265458 RepID=UPI0012D4C173|nr:uncharacterized protein LOC116342122 [Contarinia nasturtii]
MELFNILSLTVLSLSGVLSVNQYTMLDDHSVSNRIQLIQATVFVPHLFEAAFKNNGADWMDKCCGEINGEAGSSSNSNSDNTTLQNVVTALNQIFTHFNRAYADQVTYTQTHYRIDTNAILAQTANLKRLAQNRSTSPGNKFAIFAICADIRINMCWMKTQVKEAVWEHKWNSPDVYITRNGNNVYTHQTMFH